MDSVSGYNYDEVRSKISVQDDTLSQLDALDGKTDGVISESIFTKAQTALLLAKGHADENKIYDAMVNGNYEEEQKTGLARKILDIILGALGVRDNDDNVQTKQTKSKRSDSNAQNTEAELDTKLQDVVELYAQRMAEAAEKGEDMFDDGVFDLSDNDLGSFISGIEFNPDYSDSSNDKTKVSITKGKITTTLKADGLEIVVTFNINGRTYRKSTISRDENIVAKLHEEDTDVTYEKDIQITVGGQNVNDD